MLEQTQRDTNGHRVDFRALASFEQRGELERVVSIDEFPTDTGIDIDVVLHSVFNAQVLDAQSVTQLEGSSPLYFWETSQTSPTRAPTENLKPLSFLYLNSTGMFTFR